MNHTSATADGRRLVFKRWWVQRQVYVADLEPRPTHITNPTRLTHSEGNEVPMAWTADSQAVIFVSNRAGAWGIYKQSLRQEAVEPMILCLKTAVVPSVSPDGNWLLYTHGLEEAGLSAKQQLMRVPITGGQPEVVLSGQFDEQRCARSIAIMCVLGERTSDLRKLTFTSFDPVKGRDRELTRFDTDPNAEYEWDLSPDGTRIAIAKYGEGQIHILSLRGQPVRELELKGWNSLENLHWSPDGKGFFAASRTPDSSVLLHVDLLGDAHILWEQKGTPGNESPGQWGYRPRMAATWQS